MLRARLCATPALAAAVFWVAGCGTGAAATDGTRNVVLVVVDTLGAEHVSCYGVSDDTTPNLDHLASRGLRFARALAHKLGLGVDALDVPAQALDLLLREGAAQDGPALVLELVARFGMGKAAKVDAVRVVWPTGEIEEFDAVQTPLGVTKLELVEATSRRSRSRGR